MRARFAVREERFLHGAFEASILLPRAADELIDESDFDEDERLPYWADLWPSARALARYVLDAPEMEPRALELGCGVALPSLALRHRGVDVLATDYYADALRFAEANATRNGLAPFRTAELDWRWPGGAARWPLILAADVLYEKRNADILADLLPRLVTPGGRVLLADPGRLHAPGFRDAMVRAGWSVAVADTRTEVSDEATGAMSTIRIFELRPPVE